MRTLSDGCTVCLCNDADICLCDEAQCFGREPFRSLRQ